VWPNHYHHGHHSRHSESRANGETVLSFKDLEAILLDTPSSELAEKWLQYYTSGPHLAGKNLSQAEWTRDKWEQWGISSHIVAYDCYTNYPVDHSLALLKQSKHSKSWDVDFKASLEEDILEEDATSGLEDRIPTFHGYSASGNVTGSFIYVNYGTYQDYEDLINIGVNFTGKIVIARYGGIFRGLKVKRAQELGAVGALLYSDPGDDGEITEENGYDYYPNGPARHPSSVQRGSVQFLSFAPGDPYVHPPKSHPSRYVLKELLTRDF
jgi:N-acetylated-alpha-linked acidic dipeptidase